MTSSERIKLGIEISKLYGRCAQCVKESNIDDDIKSLLLHSLHGSIKHIRNILTLVYISK